MRAGPLGLVRRPASWLTDAEVADVIIEAAVAVVRDVDGTPDPDADAPFRDRVAALLRLAADRVTVTR